MKKQFAAFAMTLALRPSVILRRNRSSGQSLPIASIAHIGEMKRQPFPQFQRYSALHMAFFLFLFLAVEATPAKGDVDTGHEDKHNQFQQEITSFDVVFPSGYGLSLVTVASSDSLIIGRRARVEASDGTPGNATNAGPRPVVNEDGSAGAIVSTSDIWIRHGGVATVAKSSRDVHLGSDTNVNSIVENALLTPLARRTINVPSLRGSSTNTTVRAAQSMVLAPGRYREVEIGPALDRMELWVDGVKKYTEKSGLSFYTQVYLAAGRHRFDVFAVNTNGTKWLQTTSAVTGP